MDYKYIEKHYRLIAIDLSRQKQLDVDLKPSAQIEFNGQLKNIDGLNADEIQSMFVLTI